VGRVLAVDLGARRVGLALTDPLRILASPLETIPFSSLTKLAVRLAGLCAERGAELVVVGLPFRADGTEGPGCERARVLIGMLRDRGIAARGWDESWSSRDAEAALGEAGRKRRSDPGRVDSMAASLFLRSFLEAGAPAEGG
jgi:putative holliday junction resolvase